MNGYVKSQTAVVYACIALAIGFISGITLTIYKLDSKTSFVHQSGQPNQQNQQVDRDGMLEALEDEVKRDPDNAGAWVQLGHMYFDRDEHNKAIQAYETSL